MKAYLDAGNAKSAIEFYEKIPAQIEKTSTTYDLALRAYNKDGRNVEELFFSIPENKKDALVYTTMVDIVGEKGDWENAQATFNQLVENQNLLESFGRELHIERRAFQNTIALYKKGPTEGATNTRIDLHNRGYGTSGCLLIKLLENPNLQRNEVIPGAGGHSQVRQGEHPVKAGVSAIMKKYPNWEISPHPNNPGVFFLNKKR